VPICLGFGISSREQVERFSGICDGVAVGSAIVRTVEEALPLLTSADASKKEAGIAAVRDFIASLKPRSSP
jgi:tryptophan synthase alpha chain